MTEHRMDFSSRPEDLNDVHAFLERVWAAEQSVSPGDQMAFETALIELAANVVQHAGSGAGVSCQLSVIATPTALSAQLTDTGEPGAFSLAVREMPDELAESGRGIPLVRQLVDRLEFERIGNSNSWSIRRNREGATETHQPTDEGRGE